MARPPQNRPDPARDAAALLRRLGFVVLFVGLPLAALLSRRGPAIALPLGVFLLLVAACLDEAVRPLRYSAGALLSSFGAVALFFAVGWAAVSLLWTPFAAAASLRLLTIGAILGLGLLLYLALPERMRAANLYLVPVGCAASALAIILAVLLTGGGRVSLETDGVGIDRAVCVTLLLLWPALAWLRSRERDLEALTLAILTATACLMVTASTPIPLALGAGAAVYAVVTLLPAFGATLLAALITLTLVVPALLPFTGTTILRSILGTGKALTGLSLWANGAASDPSWLVTGHGFSAHLAGRLEGVLPLGISPALPVQLWYDLGIVGVVTVIAAIWFGLRAAIGTYAPLLPGVAATYATAFALACLGLGIGQPWWLASLISISMTFVTAERGQYRTRRPRVRLFAASRAAS